MNLPSFRLSPPPSQLRAYEAGKEEGRMRAEEHAYEHGYLDGRAELEAVIQEALDWLQGYDPWSGHSAPEMVKACLQTILRRGLREEK